MTHEPRALDTLILNLFFMSNYNVYFFVNDKKMSKYLTLKPAI